MATCSGQDRLGKTVVLVGEQLITQLGEDQGEDGKLNEDTLNKLHFIYGSSLYQALDAIDKNEIKCLTAAGKRVYVIQASRGTNRYICIHSLNYCMCPYFTYRVLVRGDALICKHLLTIKLAISLGSHHLQPQPITLSELTLIANNNK